MARRKQKKCMVLIWLFIIIVLTIYTELISTLSTCIRGRCLFRSERYYNTKDGPWSRTGKYDVLLNSYMNSGSTFTGRLLGFHKDSFYFYEPLWHITLWSYYRNNTTMCSTTTTSCRYISRSEMNRNEPIAGRMFDMNIIHDVNQDTAVPIEIPQKILDYIYSCNLSRIVNLIQPGITANENYSGHSWAGFRRCEAWKRPDATCVAGLEMNCKDAKHRVSKVLRITLGALEPVLKHNPKLKIIHLFRDPRSIINSRIETKGYPLSWNPLGSLDIQNNAKALCSKMITDLREGEKLMKKFPERFRFIHYEDLVLNSDSIRKLYDYVGMTLHTDNLDNVYEIKINTAQRQSEKKERARRRNNALWWRTYLSYDNIRQIDAICYSVIVKLGYSIFDNVSDLRNITKTNGLHNIKFKL